MSVRHRITSDSALYLAGELIEAAANAPSADYAAYGPFEDTLVLVDATGTTIVPLPGYVATLRPGEGRFGGAVAVEEGTTNLVPSNRLKFEGWTAYSGAQVTLTQNVEFPEIGRNDATRIRTTGGTSTLKYFTSIETSIAGQAYTGSVYIKNIGSKPVRFRTQIGPIVTVNPGEWTRAIVSGIGNGTTNFQLQFLALNVDDDLDFIAWGPQAERKPFATSFVAGTRAAGRLQYDSGLVNPDSFTIAAWVLADWTKAKEYGRVWELHSPSSNDRLELVRAQTDEGFRLYFHLGGTMRFGISKTGFPSGWYHTAVTFDGNQYRLYVNGESVINVAHTEKVGADWRLSVGYAPTSTTANPRFWNSLIDELLILPYAASEEEVRSLYQTTVARFHANGDVSIKGELVEGDTGFRYGSDGNLHVNELVEGVSF